MTVFFVWAWRRWSVGSGLGCRRGVRCVGVVVLGGGAVGGGLGSAGSRCWGGAGARHLTAFIGRFPAPGIRGVGARPLLCCRLGVAVPAWCVPGGGRALVLWVPGAGIGRGARSVSLCVCV